MNTTSEVVRKCFAAYELKDRGTIDSLLAKDFTFTSPLDDCISRERYFERCWPNSEHIDAVHIERLFAQGDEAFVQYEIESKGKPRFRNTEFFTVRNGKVTHVDVYFGAETGEAAAEEEVRSVIESWAEDIRKKDVEGVASHFTEDSVRFYLAPPLQADQGLRENLKSWFATFSGEIGYEIRELSITTGAGVAYCHSFNRVTGTKVDGEETDVWFRETLCLRQIDGKWLITHAHESVPFYMDGSLKAAVDLRPA